MAGTAQPRTTRPGARAEWMALGLVLVVAAALRSWHLGTLSFWYDEVVPIRLARQPGPVELVRLLDQIDATRAPLHPLLLMAWVRVFGTTEAAARTLSVLSGVATVALVYRIARSLFEGATTALWAAWLAAISPLLVLYARESRMYAWLVLLACLAWWTLISFRQAAPFWKQLAYALVLAALVYSQPLGLFMVAALGLAYLANRADLRLSVRGWLATQGGAALLVAPWIGRYLDHEPEVTTSQSLKLLLGMPIGFIGGDRRTLLGCLALIAIGLVAIGPRGEAGRWRVRVDRPFAAKMLWLWFLVPPLVLFGYSQVGHPLFGPARYTLFVGPAYLILVARGLGKLPWYASALAALALAVYAGILLKEAVYAPDLKADWRAASPIIRARSGPSPVVLVLSADPRRNVEVETARYYLGPGIDLVPSAGPPAGLDTYPRAWDEVWIAVGLRRGVPVVRPPDPERTGGPSAFVILEIVDVPGLRLLHLRRH